MTEKLSFAISQPTGYGSNLVTDADERISCALPCWRVDSFNPLINIYIHPTDSFPASPATRGEPRDCHSPHYMYSALLSEENKSLGNVSEIETRGFFVFDCQSD